MGKLKPRAFVRRPVLRLPRTWFSCGFVCREGGFRVLRLPRTGGPGDGTAHGEGLCLYEQFPERILQANETFMPLRRFIA